MVIRWYVCHPSDLRNPRVTRNAQNLGRVCSRVLNGPDDGVLTTARADNQYFSHGFTVIRSWTVKIVLF
jgi:hypothetical protein